MTEVEGCNAALVAIDGSDGRPVNSRGASMHTSLGRLGAVASSKSTVAGLCLRRGLVEVRL